MIAGRRERERERLRFADILSDVNDEFRRGKRVIANCLFFFV